MMNDQRRRHEPHNQHARLGIERVVENIEGGVREDVLRSAAVVSRAAPTLLWRGEEGAIEPVRHAVGDLPKEDSHGALTRGGDLRPFE